jgi:hypothetical protein
MQLATIMRIHEDLDPRPWKKHVFLLLFEMTPSASSSASKVACFYSLSISFLCLTAGGFALGHTFGFKNCQKSYDDFEKTFY